MTFGGGAGFWADATTERNMSAIEARNDEARMEEGFLIMAEA
jgi:hypothetical protein